MKTLIALSVMFTLACFASLNITVSPSPSTETIEVYIYTLIIETNSDWTAIEFSGGPTILCYNYTIAQGIEAPGLTCVIEPTFISVCKEPYDQTRVLINVSVIAIKRDYMGSITIKKGEVGSTKVSMYAWVGGDRTLVWSVVNDGTNPQHPGTNDRSFTLSFEQLYEHPAGVGVYEDLAEKLSEQVLAFYYPWYGVAHGASGQWFHWEGVTRNSIANTAHYPLLGVYDSWDERLIETHILLAKHAGIDGFIVSWWGPRSFEDQSLKRIIKVAEKYDFKVTIYYESYRPWSPLVSPSDIASELSYAVREYSGSRAFLKINGRPVIFIYAIEAHNREPSFWLQVRRSLESEVGPVYLFADVRNPFYVHVFDGFHTYIEFNSSAMKELYSFYCAQMIVGLYGSNFHEAIARILAGDEVVVQRKALFYTVIPGFDNRKISQPGIYVDRGGGLLYQKMWSDALELSAKHVLITSWNELHEGTEIEPTKEYEFKYLEMTRNYASKLKHRSTEEAPLPSLSLDVLSNTSKDELYLKFFNEGGPAVAVRVEMMLPSDTTAHITSAYRQPSEPSVEAIIIPLIKSGEEYELIVKIESASEGDLDVARLNVQYYSLNGTSYKMGLTIMSGVEGYVKDEAGRPLSEVNVIALSRVASIGKVSETRTDDKGHYLLELPAGDFALVFSATGYADRSIDVSLKLGELKRVNAILKRAKAEFSENWGGTKFEVALITEEPWKAGEEASVEVWITVNDMGGNQRVEFRQIELRLCGTGVEKTVPLSVETSLGGTVYSSRIFFGVFDGLAHMSPGSVESYSLELSLEGIYIERQGIARPGLAIESTSVKVYAPLLPVMLSAELPAKVKVGDEFEVKVRIRNEGEYPINDVKVALLLPRGTSAVCPQEWSKNAIDPKEETVAVFKLRADFATTATVNASLCYMTPWSHSLSEVKTLGLLSISRAPTSISIFVEPSQVNVGKSVAVKGTIKPAMAVPITLTVRGPDGEVRVLNTTSSLNGTFSLTVILDKEGKHSFIVSFLGDVDYEGATSNEAYAEAVPTPASAWLYPAIMIGFITMIAATLLSIKRGRAKTKQQAQVKKCVRSERRMRGFFGQTIASSHPPHR